jgi:tRNA pseudouridine38-40 synthase
LGGNSYLPQDIRIIWTRQADENFHARYNAIARLYRYIIYNKPVNSALQYKQTTWCYQYLDDNAMHSAAQHLVGNHDYSSFRAQGCQSKSPYRVVHFIDVYRLQDTVVIEICANAFLHHMVRNIAGVLMAVGSGRKTVAWPLALLEAKNRALGGITAPPNGLFLAGVCYPDNFGMPKHPAFEKLPEHARRYETTADHIG